MIFGIKRLSDVQNTAYIITYTIGYFGLCMSKGGIAMDGAIAGALQFVTSKKGNIDDSKKLLSEIETVKMKLETATARFEYQSDPDLVDACIYEMKSLSSRYSYLIREAKKLGVTKDANSSLEHTTHP